MPGGNGTGPMGMGPMTGRGAGFCNPSMSNVNNRASFGVYGQGRGYRRQYYATGIPGYHRNDYIQYGSIIDERSFLNRQKLDLENELKQVEGRLSEIETNSE